MEKERLRRVAGLSANRMHNISKIHTSYTLQHEESQINKARRKKGLIRRLTAFFILAAIISYFMISTLISQNSILADKGEEKAKLDKELAALSKEEVLLKEELVKLNDDDYIAKLARKEYFLSEDGEIIFTLPEKKKSEVEKASN